MNLTKHAQTLIEQHLATISHSDNHFVGIDATCGNGNDSVFLARQLNRILCFDIQEQAIANTSRQLQKAQLIHKAELIQRSHSFIQEEVQQKHLIKQIHVVMFNFGYLPKSSDLSITTTKQSSVLALQQAIHVLAKNGVISLLCYRGHDGGEAEFEAVNLIVQQLDQQKWQVSYFESYNPTATTPLLLFLQKKQ